MKTLKSLALVLTVILSASVFAQKPDPKFGSDLPMPKDALIEILKYVEKTDSYEVQSVNFPGEGITFVTPEGLARAIPSLDLERMKNAPNKVVGTQYKLDKTLNGLTDEELKIRGKKKKKR